MKCEACGNELRTCGKCGWSKVYEEDMGGLREERDEYKKLLHEKHGELCKVTTLHGKEIERCSTLGKEIEQLKADLESLEGIVKAAVIPCHICLQNGCDCKVTPLWDFATGDMVVRQYNEIERLQAIDERESLIAMSIRKENEQLKAQNAALLECVKFYAEIPQDFFNGHAARECIAKLGGNRDE